MEVRAAKRFNKENLGYYLDKPIAVVGGYDREITLISGASDARYTGAPFVDDDWFKFIAGATTHRSIYVTRNPKGVGRCLTVNSRFDDDILRRYSFRLLLPDLVTVYKDLGDVYGADFLNDALPDIVKEIFETKRDSYNRIFEVITEEYEPLYNLDVTYEETHSGTDIEGIDTETDTSREKDGADTNTRTGTETTTISGSENTKDNNGSKNTTNNSTYAFNSSDPVPESTSEVLFSKDETKSYSNRSDEVEYNTTDRIAYGSEETESATIATDRSFTHGEEITTRRYGNQGITRSDELVRAELTLRKEVDFIRLVVDDVVKQLSII